MKVEKLKKDDKFVSGKYEGMTIGDVVEKDPEYIRMLYFTQEFLTFEDCILVYAKIPPQYFIKKPRKQPEFVDAVSIYHVIQERKRVREEKEFKKHPNKSNPSKKEKNNGVKELARNEISKIVGHNIVCLMQNTTLCQYRVNNEMDLYIVSQKTFDLVNKVWDKYELGKLQEYLDTRLVRYNEIPKL